MCLPFLRCWCRVKRGMTPRVGKTPYQDISELMPLWGSIFTQNVWKYTHTYKMWAKFEHTKRGQYTGKNLYLCYFSLKKIDAEMCFSCRYDLSFRVSIQSYSNPPYHTAVQHCLIISRGRRLSPKFPSYLVLNPCSLSPPARFFIWTIGRGKEPQWAMR